MGMNFVRIWAVAVVVALVGCTGDKPIPVAPPAAQSATASAKAVLDEVAQTGNRGSGMMQLRQDLEKLKQTDATRGTELLSDLDALEAASQPEAIKAKAKAMADKL